MRTVRVAAIPPRVFAEQMSRLANARWFWSRFALAFSAAWRCAWAVKRIDVPVVNRR